MKIIFVGGGTMGHVSPNLAIISELKKISKRRSVALNFLYIGKIWGAEKKVVEGQGLAYKGIFTGKLRRYFSWQNFLDPFLILLGFIQSFFILLFNRPKIVFAKGGFVTVPFCFACIVLRVPFVIHESDSMLGLSNRILKLFAKKIYLGFPIEVYEGSVPAQKSLFVGNPVRDSISEAKENRKAFLKKYGLSKNKKVIFVFGGSQGSQTINKVVSRLIERIVKKYILIHSTGRAAESYFKEGFLNLDKKDREDYMVFGYIDQEMPEFLNNADIIISRAGANSIAEIVAVKKPSIIIPLPSAAGDHQNKNADFLKKSGTAVVLDEDILSPDRLFSEIERVISNNKIRNGIIKNMKKTFPEVSSRGIANDLSRLLKEKKYQ